MSDETDAKKILTASSFDNWRRPPACHTTWMKTTQQDLMSNILSLNEAIGSETSTVETDVYVWCYALLMVCARYEDEEEDYRVIFF